jgi:hypothetical protein
VKVYWKFVTNSRTFSNTHVRPDKKWREVPKITHEDLESRGTAKGPLRSRDSAKGLPRSNYLDL